MKKILILALIFLIGCNENGGSSGGGNTATTTTIEENTWPPKSSSEFLAFLEGKTFKMEGYEDYIRVSSGILTYSGAASDLHLAYIRTSNTTYYTQNYACNYKANELFTSNYSTSAAFTLKFNITETNSNDYSPNIQNCKKINCPSCAYYEESGINFLSQTNCFEYNGYKFCKQ